MDFEMCLAAVKKDGRAFRYVPGQFATTQMCELAVEADSKLLKKVPESFKTLELCIRAVKTDAKTLLYVPEEKRYELFNDNTEINLIEKVVSRNPEWLVYMPNRPDVRALCISCMKKNFFVAQYMPEQIKASEDILNYQKLKGKLKFTHKYYDSEEKSFNAEIQVVYGQYKTDENESYCVQKKFEDFEKFYDFLDGNLHNAELENYSFHGIDLKKYNIEGATINSAILQAQGLYDGTYFASVKKGLEADLNEAFRSSEVAAPNEFCYLKPIDDGEYDQTDIEHVLFFYISDIHLVHRVCNKFKDRATKEEIHSYIKSLARNMVSSIGTRPLKSYLLIAGDTSSIFEFTAVFYNELIQYWAANQIVVVPGNHELWDPYVDMAINIQTYRKFFDDLGITFLQNDLMCIQDGRRMFKNEETMKTCQEEASYIADERKIFSEEEILKMSEEEIRWEVQDSSVIILGGIGFSGLNEKYNASNVRYGRSFDELPRDEALQKDIQEANRFNILYTKVLNSLGKSRVIVLTHVKKDDWNTDAHNPLWIYLNGHNHRNYYEVNDQRTIYADNQIGYGAKNVGLKYFSTKNDYDIFAYYQDGVHKITKEQYIEFNRGKQVSITFERKSGTIYVIKRNDVYLFLIYCEYMEHSGKKALYLMDGGKLIRLERNRLVDLSYYYDRLERYAKNVNQLLYPYSEIQQKLSKSVKKLGGSGKIHGCIIDVEKPNELEGFSRSHLFVNPLDGKVTPYIADDKKSRLVCKDFKALLQAYDRYMINDSCKLITHNYLQLEKDSVNNLSLVQYSRETGNSDYVYDEETKIYGISTKIKKLQYCTEKSIVRLWDEKLLSYNLDERPYQIPETKNRQI